MVTILTPPDTLPVVAPADDVAGLPQGAWTHADYHALPADGCRYELIDGVLYRMTSPSAAHQSASNLFAWYLTAHVQFGGLGRVYSAPFDVVLGPGTTVQPDVMVVLAANLGIITPQHIAGTPDVVVEIQSQGTAGHDRRGKQDACARAGVREYWLADPAADTLEVLGLVGGGGCSLGVVRGKATPPSTVLPGLPVRAEQFFA